MKSDGPAPAKTLDQEDPPPEKKRKKEKEKKFEGRKNRTSDERSNNSVTLDLRNRLALGSNEETGASLEAR